MHWASIVLVVVIAAGILAFGGAGGGTTGIGKILLVILPVLFIIGLVSNSIRRA
ncbi:MAG: DUF1328 domain-containing protein [Armatimonadota bacterium]